MQKFEDDKSIKNTTGTNQRYAEFNNDLSEDILNIYKYILSKSLPYMKTVATCYQKS